MKKYYKIPMTERIATINNQSLFKTLQENYPELYERELGRVELTYGGPNPGAFTPQLESEVEKYNQETARIYQSMGVPFYIIGAQENEDCITECITGLPIETTYGRNTIITGQEISKQEAYEYLSNQENYSSVISNMFVKKEEPKTLFKKIQETIFGKKDN